MGYTENLRIFLQNADIISTVLDYVLLNIKRHFILMRQIAEQIKSVALGPLTFAYHFCRHFYPLQKNIGIDVYT